MKAILIDVKNKDVIEVEYKDNIEHLAELLECDVFTVPVQIENGDALYVDDESLLKSADRIPGAFLFSEYPHQPLFGNGLILGTTDEGESQDVRSKLGNIRKMVSFLKPDQVIQQHEELSNRPIQIYFDHE